MRIELLVSGIALLVVGVGLFLIAWTQLPTYESLLGQVGMVISPSMQEDYRFLTLMETIGPAIGVAGLILGAFGIATSPAKEE